MTNTTSEGLAERLEKAAAGNRQDRDNPSLLTQAATALHFSEEQQDRMRGALEKLCAAVAKVETAAFGNRVETEDWMMLSFARQAAEALSQHQEKL